ncbi:DUF4268 domain-containing protein [Anaeromyxobacter oryzae]|uniref:CBS domain-containing protein n=1 Tax=Anaeromyxobacter oryzae TaxID=2918170 RepID=A0ABN6MQV5_9BACT|nr:DUF4268 domain-containing protein [Anaeromyxobacter oryzae]BDG02836.1 hypothetical protein AMOR_18320 [Anaeromyxobacter oryzae]
MPATVSDLVQGKAPPLTIAPGESLATALAEMSENDYSQLPVAGPDRRPIALLTIDSVGRALRHFGVVPSALRVLDAMDEFFERCDTEDELLDVLDALQRSSAVLVLTPQQELTGILTSFDAMEFFRRRAQDIMVVQDIEETIKDFVLSAFRREDDSLDQASLTTAIEAITPSNAKLRGPFRKAIHAFLSARNVAAGPDDEALLTRTFNENLASRDPAKTFEQLTLNDYIELLLHEARWGAYGPAFGIERDALRRLLVSVRNTRNDLAHFRTDIADRQRDELFFCKEWLARHEDALKAAVTQQRSGRTPAAKPPPPTKPVEPRPSGEPGPPMETLGDVDIESRYAALGATLRSNTTDDRVVLKFSDVEKILGAPLPASARQYRAWWSNNERGHVQAKQWIDAGWHVAEVSTREQYVTFIRTPERQAAYRRFFDGLTATLGTVPGFPPQRPPSGVSWHVVANAPESGPRMGMFVVSFARAGQLRVELYIDAGDQKETKGLFDAMLRRRAELEAGVGEPLSWERLDGRRASRIALYYPGAVLDADETLQAKAASAMVRFRAILSPAFDAALKESKETVRSG